MSGQIYDVRAAPDDVRAVCAVATSFKLPGGGRPLATQQVGVEDLVNDHR